LAPTQFLEGSAGSKFPAAHSLSTDVIFTRDLPWVIENRHVTFPVVLTRRTVQFINPLTMLRMLFVRAERGLDGPRHRQHPVHSERCPK
jgi:hypothetical protein